MAEAGGSESGGPAPKVLRPAGAGRSGTTVLGLLLGERPGCAFVGELSQAWNAFSTDAWTCACGARIAECGFWREVRGRAFGAAEPDYERLAGIWRSRVRLNPRALASIARRPRRDPELGEHAEGLARLHGAIAAQTGARVVVDSTHSVPDAILLAGTPGIDLYLVHMVRDPRGVADSAARPVAGPPGREGLEAERPAGSSIRWLARNAAVEALLARDTRRVLRLRYEDLAADPTPALAAVAELLGEPAIARDYAGERTLHPGRHHAVDANPRLLGGPARLRLRLDERWRSRMPRRARLAAALPALPLMLRYGYRR